MSLSAVVDPPPSVCCHPPVDTGRSGVRLSRNWLLGSEGMLGRRWSMRPAVRFFATIAMLATAVIEAWPALAGVGQPSPGQMGMQGPVTEIAANIVGFHDRVNIIIIAITAFVLILLAYVIVRFNETANPKPSRTTHNTALEVAWTIIPIFILVVIALPSFKLLYDQYSYPKADLTMKAVANAWFWEHEYPDQGIRVTSNMLRDEDVLQAKHGKDYLKKFDALEPLAKIKAMYAEALPLWTEQKLIRQLSVDNEIAVPAGKIVHLLITSNDVIHSWTIPSFGSKMQAVPGRVTATWFKADTVGAYYGQCSVLCGKEHSSMPIAVRVVPEAAFNNWIAAVKARDLRRARSILQAATEEPDAPKYAGAPQQQGE
jgi:cytochrome c oxidase subunit II